MACKKIHEWTDIPKKNCQKREEKPTNKQILKDLLFLFAIFRIIDYICTPAQ